MTKSSVSRKKIKFILEDNFKKRFEVETIIPLMDFHISESPYFNGVLQFRFNLN